MEMSNSGQQALAEATEEADVGKSTDRLLLQLHLLLLKLPVGLLAVGARQQTSQGLHP